MVWREEKEVKWKKVPSNQRSGRSDIGSAAIVEVRRCRRGRGEKSREVKLRSGGRGRG